MIGERLGWLGAVIDPAANADDRETISAPGSAMVVQVVLTDEERVVAQATLALVSPQERR